MTGREAGAVDWDLREAEVSGGVAHEEAPRKPRPRGAVRQRPSRRYDSPEEMWAWHRVRLLVAVAWTAYGTLGTVCCLTALIFYVELAL